MKPLDEAVGAVVRALGVDEAEIALRKEFLEFTAEDVAQLCALHESLVATHRCCRSSPPAPSSVTGWCAMNGARRNVMCIWHFALHSVYRRHATA